MEVIFGVQARDGALRVQIADDKAEALRAEIEAAMGAEKSTLIWVTDKDGREYGIPVDKIAFVEFGTQKESRQVGFAS